jgi:hypothetical protein
MKTSKRTRMNLLCSTRILCLQIAPYIMGLLFIWGISCTKAELTPQAESQENQTATIRSHNFSGFASASGVVDSGEYAGQTFRIRIRATYSGTGPSTLVSGEATVRIGADVFHSIIDSTQQSFCCGEGQLIDDGTLQEFDLSGQIQHTTDIGTHNHLFGASARTDGIFSFSLLDQTGTVLEVAGGPNHDPGLGEIFEIDANVVRVHVQ